MNDEEKTYRLLFSQYKAGIRKVIADIMIHNDSSIQQYWDDGFTAEEAAADIVDRFQAE